MKLSSARIVGLIGIYVPSVIAALYLGARWSPRLPSLPAAGSPSYDETWTAGNEDFNQGNYAAAIREYDRMVGIRPTQFDGYFNRATAEYCLQQYDRAIQDDTAGLRIFSPKLGTEKAGEPESDPDRNGSDSVKDAQASLYGDRAFSYAAKGDLAHAVADDRRVILLKPNDVSGYEALSALYEQQRQYRLDIALWETAIEHTPGDATCRCNLGWEQYLAGDIPGSMVSSRRAIRLDPTMREARYNLALCYAISDQWPLAETEYCETIALKDADAQKGALQDVQDALKVHPRSQALQDAAALLGAPSA